MRDASSSLPTNAGSVRRANREIRRHAANLNSIGSWFDSRRRSRRITSFFGRPAGVSPR